MGSKKEEIKKKLVKKYRMVILTDDSFEEKISLKLNRLNVFVFGGIFSVLLIVLTILFIVYTPLKEYVSGFESTHAKRNAVALNFKLDSLQTQLQAIEFYTESLKPVLIGGKSINTDVLPYHSNDNESSIYQSGIINNDSIHQKINELQQLLDDKNKEIARLSVESPQAEVPKVKRANVPSSGAGFASSKQDSIFRANIEREEQFSLFGYEKDKADQVFIAPVKGSLTDKFGLGTKHFALDIATDKHSKVKAVEDGVVIFSEWSLQTGYVILIMHQNNYISVYKHNSKLFVAQNDHVKAGQVISQVGSTGDLSTSSHLHFELWKNGYPVDPTNFMKF